MAAARQIHVGCVPIGGGAPVAVQSMTRTETADYEATMRQIRGVADAGADLVRVAVPRDKDVEALRSIVVESPLPVVATSTSTTPLAEGFDAGAHCIRQVDAVVEYGPDEGYAYEVKIRVTDAASRQGRFSEELDFPEDCEASGYTPRLLVFDKTESKTLSELIARFEAHGGDWFLGPDAYAHIGETAGVAQAEFLKRYVAEPLKAYEDSMPDAIEGRTLADLRLAAAPHKIEIEVAGFEPYTIERDADDETVLSEDCYESEEP